MAKQLVTSFGASVTIIARGEEELTNAANNIRAALLELPEHLAIGRIQAFSCDCTNFEAVQTTMQKATISFGEIHWLICAAGSARPGRFHEIPLEDFEKQMKLNYFGTVIPIKILINDFLARSGKMLLPKKEQDYPKIIMVASQAGLMSCIGYSAYSPGKFALRGLAESLRNEYCNKPFRFHILFPGNMKTLGYEEENKTKPNETKEIEASEPLQDPLQVAIASIDSIRKGDFAIFGGNFSGYFLGRMTFGLLPRSTMFLDCFVAPILVLAAWLNRMFVLDRIVKRAR